MAAQSKREHTYSHTHYKCGPHRDATLLGPAADIDEAIPTCLINSYLRRAQSGAKRIMKKIATACLSAHLQIYRGEPDHEAIIFRDSFYNVVFGGQNKLGNRLLKARVTPIANGDLRVANEFQYWVPFDKPMPNRAQVVQWIRKHVIGPMLNGLQCVIRDRWKGLDSSAL